MSKNAFRDTQISNTAGFDLINGYFTAVENHGLSLTVRGYRNGLEKYEVTSILNPLDPTFLALNFLGVDQVVFSPSGGTRPGAIRPTNFSFIIDNLTVDNIVPLPAAAWLFLSALGGLGFFGWRKQRLAS